MLRSLVRALPLILLGSLGVPPIDWQLRRGLRGGVPAVRLIFAVTALLVRLGNRAAQA